MDNEPRNGAIKPCAYSSVIRTMRTLILFVALVVSATARPQTSTLFAPDGFVTINSGQGGFTAALDPGDRFSRYHDAAGDVNGDGLDDLYVGGGFGAKRYLCIQGANGKFSGKSDFFLLDSLRATRL